MSDYRPTPRDPDTPDGDPGADPSPTGRASDARPDAGTDADAAAAYGQRPPSYGDQPPYGQQPAPGQQPDYGQASPPGQPLDFGQQAGYGQAPAYGPPGYAQPGYGQPPTVRVQKSGLAIAALVLGIVALLLFWTVFGGIVLGLGAVILGFVARSKVKSGTGGGGGLAVGGIVTGLIALVFSIGFLVLVGNVINQVRDCDPTAPQAEYEQCVEDRLTD